MAAFLPICRGALGSIFMIFRRSLISEFMNTAGGVFTVLFSIVLTVGIVRVMSQVAVGKSDAGAILQMVLYTSLTTLAPLLALSLFLAILMALIRSWQQNEMIVWFSSGGLSLLSWIRPVLRFSLPVVLLTAVVALAITPWARGQMDVSKAQFSQRDDTSRIASGKFIESSSGRRVFFIQQVSEDTQNVKGIFVSELNRNGKATVVSSTEGRLRINKEGDRYVELTDGKRYEIAPDAKSYRVTGFGTYGIRLDIKPDQILSPDKVYSLPTSYLLNDPNPKNLGQFFWRLSWPLMALNLVLFAIPLSFTNPRAGKSLNVVVAVLVFILYLNFINIMESWISEGRWHWWSGLIALHGSMLLLTALLFVRRIWLQRWLPRELTIGYWRDRME